MSIFTSILTAGTNSHPTTSEEANRFLTNFVTPGIVGAFTSTTGAFAVTAQGTPNKTLNVASGDAVVTATPNTQASQNLNVRSNATTVITIADNTSGATRYDWIYLAIDATKANNPAVDASDVASIVVNRSTSSAVDTVGAPAYRELLAIVTVANGFASLAAGTIADNRRAAGAAVGAGTISNSKLANKAVTFMNISPTFKMGQYAATGAALTGSFTSAVSSGTWTNPSIVLTAPAYVRLSFEANTSYGAATYGSSWQVATSNDNSTWRLFTGTEVGPTLGVNAPFGSTFNNLSTSSGELVGSVAAEGAVLLAAGTYYFVPQFTARIGTGSINYSASLIVEVLGLS